MPHFSYFQLSYSFLTSITDIELCVKKSKRTGPSIKKSQQFFFFFWNTQFNNLRRKSWRYKSALYNPCDNVSTHGIALIFFLVWAYFELKVNSNVSYRRNYALRQDVVAKNCTSINPVSHLSSYHKIVVFVRRPTGI